MAGDIKLKYGTTITPTVTALQSLATSSTWQSGFTTDWIDNSSVLALDYILGGNIYAGTSPTGNPGEIRAYAYGTFDSSYTAPDLFSSGTEGTTGAVTVTDGEQLAGGLVLLWATATDTTSDEGYPIRPTSVAQAFGGVLPRKFAIYIAHNTGVNLKSTLNALYLDPVLQQYT